MFELFASLVLGILVGIVAGLIPGIHPNMVVLFVPIIAAVAAPLPGAVFIAALGVANCVIDFLPSIFLGAPEENALSTLPGHRMLIKGQGYDAVKIAVIGCIAAAALLVPLIPILYYAMPVFIASVAPYTHVLVGGIALYMLARERERIAGLLVFTLAAAIGVLSLRLPVDGALILFPLMSGFFGVPSLILHGNSNETPTPSDAAVSFSSIRRGIFSGVIGGIASGFLPGVGTGQIAALFSRDRDDHAFLAATGAIATANVIVSMLALSIIGKARSGVAVAIGQLGTVTNETLLAIVFASLASAACASLAALWVAKRAARLTTLSKASPFVVLLIALLVFAFSGFYGLLVLLAAASVGIYAVLSGASRGLMMSSLMVPVILFYLQ